MEHIMILQAQLVSLSELSPEMCDDMFRLMGRYYSGVRRDAFESDLHQKDWIIQIVERDTGILRGFSTQVLWDILEGDHAARVLFSGDTIIDHRYWGNNPLAQTWGRFVLSLIDEHERMGIPLYWYLIVKGYKTYRFLPLFFHEFYPRFDTVTPARTHRLLDALGAAHFPAQYIAETGVIRALADGCRLRAGVADITPSRLRDSHVRYFATHNPGHTRGDELCCIAPLTFANFTPAARRVIGTSAFQSVVKT